MTKKRSRMIPFRMDDFRRWRGVEAMPEDTARWAMAVLRDGREIEAVTYQGTLRDAIRFARDVARGIDGDAVSLKG